MKITITAALGAVILLSACGPKTLALPADPIDRAATCGVVAAAEARAASQDIKSALPFTEQTKILHYALLAGSEGESFAADKAQAVVTRMQELQEEITGGKWQELAPACRAAFPLAEKDDATLPADRFDAQLGCDALADFMTTALQAQDADYGKQLNDYLALTRKFNHSLAPGLRARVGTDLANQQEARRKALVTMAHAGTPSAVMQQCVERFG